MIVLPKEMQSNKMSYRGQKLKTKSKYNFKGFSTTYKSDSSLYSLFNVSYCIYRKTLFCIKFLFI